MRKLNNNSLAKLSQNGNNSGLTTVKEGILQRMAGAQSNRGSRRLTYLLLGCCLAIFVVFGIIQTIEATSPVYWGTYSQGICVSQAQGRCLSSGSFVSDDGSTHLQEAKIDGVISADGKAKVAYRPKRLIGGKEGEIPVVTTKALESSNWVWFPWSMAVLFGGLLGWYAYTEARRNADNKTATDQTVSHQAEQQPATVS